MKTCQPRALPATHSVQLLKSQVLYACTCTCTCRRTSGIVCSENKKRKQVGFIEKNFSFNSVPAPECTAVPEVADTRLVVMWSYTHTGGLPITAVDVEFQQDAANVRTSFSDVDSSMVDGSGEMVDEGEASIPLPQAGIRYRFYVTATNSEGASTTSCPDLLLTIGQCTLD